MKKKLSRFALLRRCQFGVSLLVFRQVGLLPEVFPAQGAREGLLARVRPDVDVDGIFVLESFGADAAVVQEPLPPASGGDGRAAAIRFSGIGQHPPAASGTGTVSILSVAGLGRGQFGKFLLL